MNRRRFLRLSSAALGTALTAPFIPSMPRASAGPPAAAHATFPLDSTLPVHPALQYGAHVEPDKKVRVIIQKKTRDASGQAIAASVGASHLEEFAFIKAHHLELPQSAVLPLGGHPDILHVSPDAPVQKHATTYSTTNLKTIYPIVNNASRDWNATNPATYQATGAGITVAILDSGVNSLSDLVGGGGLVSVNVNKIAQGVSDGHGHGTHVAGVIKGVSSTGAYIGVAPDAKVISVKISDDTGAAHEADLLRGLQWCYDNRTTNGGIRIVNLSISSGTAESYKTSPVCAAAEQLWLNGIVVVAAVGNRGTAADATWYAPANDPYVITVGALDDNQTIALADDTLATFSSRGKTQDGIYKPDLVAPGRKIYSALASASCTMAQLLPTHIAADGKHIRLSGTSMAAPQVAGAVALLLQRHSGLTPNQVKGILLQAGQAYATMPDTAKLLNCWTMMMVAGTSPIPTANGSNVPNSGIQAGSNTVAWGTAYWDTAYWDTAYWDTAYWDVSLTTD